MANDSNESHDDECVRAKILPLRSQERKQIRRPKGGSIKKSTEGKSCLISRMVWFRARIPCNKPVAWRYSNLLHHLYRRVQQGQVDNSLPCTTYYAKTPFKQVVILCRIWSESVALNVCAETHPANSFLCRACSPPPVPPSWLGTVPGNGMKIRRPCCQQQQFNTTAQDKNTSLHRKQ